MNRPLSPHELEHISAYLDHQLTPAERTQLEARMAAEPGLRQEVAEIQATVQALRGLPELKVPRNFMLDPGLAKRPRSLPALAFSTLRLASTLATAAFIFVLVLDFNALRQPAALPASVEVSSRPVAEGTVTTAMEAATVVEPATQQVEATGPTLDEAEAPSLAPELGGELTGPGSGGGGGRDSSATPRRAIETETESQPDPTTTPGPTPEPLAAAAESSNADDQQTPDAPLPAAPPPNPYRPLTIGLAAIAFLLAVLTLLSRRAL